VTFGDLDAHREAAGLPAPGPTASDDELQEHLEALLLAGGSELAVAGTRLGLGEQSGRLLPLARASAYVSDNRAGVEVASGDYDEAAFGPAEPDGEIERVPLDGAYGLVVEDGVVTVARSREGLAAAVAAQHGDATSMADVPAAVDLVSALDELGVIHGAVLSNDDGSLDAVATGVAAGTDPNRPWPLIVAHHPRLPGDLDVATERLSELADDFASDSDAQVVDVESRSGAAVAVIDVDDPNLWLRLVRVLDPLLFGPLDLGSPSDE
jgi:hypothetical protein